MSRKTGERIGLFGGTFDPPHVGHVVAAVNVRHALALDRILMIPASIPWQKADFRTVSPAEDRLAMLHATIDGVDGLEVSTVEIERGGASYTADTLEELQRSSLSSRSSRSEHGASRDQPGGRAQDDREAQDSRGAQHFVIVGSDVAPSLDTWKRPDVLRQLATIVVYDRAGSNGGHPPAGWQWRSVAVPQLEVSSTDLRQRVAQRQPIDGLVTPAVARHIRVRGLYRAAAKAEEPASCP